MPLWLVVLLVLWTPVVCWLSVLLGAYVMYARQTQSNPVTGIRTSFEELFARETREKEAAGFYDG